MESMEGAMAGHRLTRQLEHLPSGPSHQPSGQQSSSLPQTPPQGRPASQSPDTLTHALPPKPSPQFPRATSYYRLQPITPLTEQEEADRQEFRDLRSLEDFEKQRGDELRLSRFEARLMKGGKGAIIYPSERPEYDRLRGLEWIQELRILRKRKEMRDNHQPGTPLSLPSLPKTPEPKPFVKPALPVKRKNSPVVIDNPHKSRLSNSRSSSAEPSTSDADTTTSSAATQASTPSPGRANQDTQVNTALAKSTAVQPAPGTPITLPVSPLLVTSGQAPTSKPISEPPTTSKPITEQAAIEEPIEEATPQPASTSEPPPRPERHLDLQDSILHGEALEHLLPSHQEVRAQLGREHWTGVTYDLWLDERMMRAIIVLELTRHGMSGEDPSKFDIGLVGPSWAYAWTQDRNRDDIRPPRGLAAAKKVLIPLCPRVNHWVLLCINKETNTATVYDALPSYVKNTAACVREFMLTFVPAFDLNIAGSIDIKHFGDGNGWDCGHSVLQCIQAFLNGMVPTASNDASIWQLEMLPQVLDFLTSIGVYDDEAPAPPLESQDDREVPLPENMAAYDFRDQDMQDNISEVGMTGYDVDPLEYDIPNDLLDFFDGDDADTSMHDATNHSSPARGDGHPCQNNNGNHDSDNDSDSDSDDNSIQGGTDNYSDDNGSNSDSDSDPDSDDPSNGERMRARELDEPEPNSEDEDEDADNFVASFNLDIAALNNDDDLDDEADGNIIGSFDWQAPVNGRNEKDDSEDSVDSDDAVSNASEDSLEDWNERTRYLPGRHFLKPIKAQQKSKWYNKEGKQVCGYPMFKTNGDYARAAFNKTWRHYNRIWAKNYLSLWAPSAEQMIASRDAGFDVSVDDDNMKCFTEYEKLRIRTGSPVAITQGKMFGPGTHTLRRLLLATGRLTPWEWECMTIRGHLLNISHLCNGGKSGCCNPWHLVIELRARNVSRSECFRHPENRSDPNREGRCRKHRIPCLQKTARFDWLHIANELYKEQSKKMLKEHYIQWNKKQISGRPKLANRNKQCPTCKRTFRKSGLLAKHVKTCGSTTERTQSTLECPICKRHFRGAGALANHRLTCANKECPTCKRTFRRPGLLAKHVETCGSTTEELECLICKRHFRGAGALANHRLTCASKECPTCKRTFRRPGLLAKHVETCGSTTERTQSTLECPICKRHFRGAGALANHRLTCASKECPTCKRTFRRPGLLAKHVETCGSTTEELECPICKRHFRWAGALANHRLTCANKECPTCKRTFLRPGRLAKHVETCSKPRSKLVKECPTCERSFEEGAPMANHIKACVKKANLTPSNTTCPTCNKTFGGPGALANHVRACVEKANRPPPNPPNTTCPICNKTFASPGPLANHMRACGKIRK